MEFILDGNIYEVVIERKNNKNLYIRVKEDMKIYVMCNYLTTKSSIKKVLEENKKALRKMISKVVKDNTNSSKFFYLGENYDIINDDNISKISIVGNTIYTRDKAMLDKWCKEEIIRVFDERYVYIYNHFNENIKSPILKIRSMKTRYGVYNKKNHTITLNSKLIEFDIEKIDYVIVHELSHIIHFDHSKAFWNLVSKYCKDYKRIRKEMRE